MEWGTELLLNLNFATGFFPLRAQLVTPTCLYHHSGREDFEVVSSSRPRNTTDDRRQGMLILKEPSMSAV